MELSSVGDDEERRRRRLLARRRGRSDLSSASGGSSARLRSALVSSFSSDRLRRFKQLRLRGLRFRISRFEFRILGLRLIV